MSQTFYKQLFCQKKPQAMITEKLLKTLSYKKLLLKVGEINT